MRTLPEVLRNVRPNVWGCVPRVWEKLHRALLGAIEAEPDDVRRAAVAQAIEVGKQCVRSRQLALRGEGPGPDDALLAAWDRADEAILSRLRERVGLDQVRWAAIGSAPTPPHVLEFFAAIGVPLCEMWGMSELTCAATGSAPGEGILGSVGRPLPGVEIRLADDGEIEVRGPIVMHGYRGEPEKTAETMTSDGWLRTGDIGRIDNGHLAIVDRKKEIIINASGKNMSPANIEAAIKAESPLVGHAVAIGDGRPYVGALLVLDPDALALWAAKHGVQAADTARLPGDERLLSELQTAVDRANQKLARVEQVRRFAVVTDVWDAGSDLLTPTMKLKRRGIAAQYANEIEALYAASS
jgi:long-subunit acyl-CoA synthetase (AMP-forming)